VHGEAQARLAALLPDSTHVVVDRAGHFVHRDRPDVVIDAIERVVKTVRAKTAAR
jgi:pimeloyl-ACP methyl ester carboxylesterase